MLPMSAMKPSSWSFDVQTYVVPARENDLTVAEFWEELDHNRKTWSKSTSVITGVQNFQKYMNDISESINKFSWPQSVPIEIVNGLATHIRSRPRSPMTRQRWPHFTIAPGRGTLSCVWLACASMVSLDPSFHDGDEWVPFCIPYLLILPSSTIWVPIAHVPVHKYY